MESRCFLTHISQLCDKTMLHLLTVNLDPLRGHGNTEKKCVHCGRNQKSYADFTIRISPEFTSSYTCILKQGGSSPWSEDIPQPNMKLSPLPIKHAYIIVFWSEISTHYSLGILLFFYFPSSSISGMYYISFQLIPVPFILTSNVFYPT